MKKRIGFVSNSSSSSFVMIVTKKGHQKAIERLNPYQKAVVKEAGEERYILGEKVVVFGYMFAHGYNTLFENLEVPWQDDFDGYDEDGPMEAFYEYREHLPEKSVVFSWSQSVG